MSAVQNKPSSEAFRTAADSALLSRQPKNFPSSIDWPPVGFRESLVLGFKKLDEIDFSLTAKEP